MRSLRITILSALVALSGCLPPNSPAPVTQGAIKETGEHLDKAGKAIASKDYPRASSEVGAGIKSNDAAGKGFQGTIDWYEARVKERDDAIVDLKKAREHDQKTLSKPIVKAAIWIDGFIKIIMALASIFLVLWLINKFVKQIPFFGPIMQFVAKIF